MEDEMNGEEVVDADLGALLDAGAGAVVTLVSGDTHLAAHAAVLAARSPALADAVETAGGQLAVAGVEGPVLRQLLAYLYTLRAPQLPSTAHQLAAAADKFSISVSESEAAVSEDLGGLLDAGDTAVVTLVAGQTQLAVHRAVLAARSPVFAAMFHHDTLEASSGRVSVVDVEGRVLRHLAAYCYTLRAPHLPDADPQLLVAADKYDVSGLKVECEHQVAARLTVENAAATAVFAVRHSCLSLARAAVAFVKDNLTVLATRGWADAVVHRPEDVVQVSRLLGAAPAVSRSLSDEDKQKGSRLVQAAEEQEMEELQALVTAGVDVMARGNERMTALHWVACWGDVEAGRLLLEAGAAVDARTAYHETPLHLAAENGHTATVRLLAAAGCDPSARDQWGSTPLHRAATHGLAEAAAALLEAGGDRAARDREGLTPLDIARHHNRRHLLDMLAVQQTPVTGDQQSVDT